MLHLPRRTGTESMSLHSQQGILLECMLLWRGSELECSSYISAKPSTNVSEVSLDKHAFE